MKHMMKKSILALMTLLMFVMILPSTIKAASLDLSKYKAETLEEAFAQEGIDFDFSNSTYDDTNELKPTIYLFRKDGCLNCKNFLNYVKNTLLAQYPDRFRIVSYELGNEPINFGLLNTLADFYDQKATTYATPVVIIKDKMFQGYVDNDMQKEIEETLLDRSNRLDVLTEIEKGHTKLSESTKYFFQTEEVNIVIENELPYRYQLKSSEVDLSHVKNEGYQYLTAYDIDIYDGNQIVSVKDNRMRICMNAPRGEGAYQVAYIKDDQIVETSGAMRDFETVCFDTDHLSQYAVYSKNPSDTTTPDDQDKPNDSSTNDNENKQPVAEENPNTADPLIHYLSLLGVGAVVLCGALMAYQVKRERR